MKHMVIGTTLAAAAAAASAVLAGPASAAPPANGVHAAATSTTTVHRAGAPSPHTRQAIASAVRHSRLLGDVPASDVTVGAIRVAGHWAGATATPKDGRTDPAQVLLHRAGSTWTVKSLGSYEVGCGIVSTSTRHRLGLHGACG